MTPAALRELAEHHRKQGEDLLEMNRRSTQGNHESRMRTDAEASWHFQMASGLNALATAFEALIQQLS